MITALLLYDAAHVGGGPRHVADLAGMLARPGTGVRAVTVPIADARPGAAVRWLSRLIRSERAEVVHTHAGRSGVVGRIAAAMAGVPAVHTWHGFHPERWSVGRHVLERVLRRYTASCIHVSLSSAAHGAKHGFPGVVVPNGIGPEPLPPVDAARGNTVVAVGRWDDPIKGADVLVRAFDYLDDVRLLMIGPAVKRAEKNPRIRRIVGDWNPAPWFARANIFASASWAEGCPYAVLEAMAAGLPVVATRVRGHVDLVVDGSTGRLVPPGNARALAAAIDALLKNPDRARQMGKAGAERVALHFTLEQMARGVIAEYRRARL